MCFTDSGQIFFSLTPLFLLFISAQEEHSLLQLEEAIEALDANLEFKNRSIQDKQKMLLISDLPLSQSQSMEPAQLSNVIKKLEDLPAPEVSQLLAKYFNRVSRVHVQASKHHSCLPQMVNSV